MICRHAEYTKSDRARRVLDCWQALVPKFVKVLPNDYKRVMEAQKRMLEQGMSADEAAMAAFELNAHDAARVGGR
jgi:glutamate synthase (ferredoxin)